MKKITTLFLGILLVPVFTFAQTATTTDSYKAQLIAVLTQLVQQLEAEIAQIIAQQAQLAAQQQILSQQTQSQIPQNTTQVFGSTQTVDSVVNAGPVSNAPTCTLIASTTPLKATTIGWTSTNAQSVSLYWATGNVAGGIVQYAVLGLPDPAHPLNPATGYMDDLGASPFKATFKGPGGSVDCFATAS